MDGTWAAAHDQFVFQRGALGAPDGWSQRAHLGWTLAHHPSLPVCDLNGANGEVIGWVLGWMVTPAGRFAAAGHPVCEPTPAAIEALVDTCTGRYAVVLLTPTCARTYLDPGGTLGMVHRPATGRVASTLTAVLWDEPDHEAMHRPRDEFPGSGANQYYPAGLTAAADVFRLLPNHFLDLSSFEAVRHYPRDDLSPLPGHAIDDAIEAMTTSIRHTLAAYAGEHPKLYLGLTAGRDTRTLIACARELMDRVELVTFDYRRVRTDRTDRSDVFAWRHLMGDHPVPRHLVPVGPATPAQEDAYSWRIGWAGGPGKARDFDLACRQHLDLDAVWVTGFAGETGRSPYAEGVDLSRPVPPEALLRCLRLDRPEFAGAMAAWYRGVAHLPPVTAFDLAFVEHRVGSWASPHMYGAAPFVANVAPLASRVVQDAMLRFPLHVKFGRDVVQDLVERAWPELADFPVESFTGWRRPAEAVRAVLGDWRHQRRTARSAGGATSSFVPSSSSSSGPSPSGAPPDTGSGVVGRHPR